jgi:hypothetical protein
MTPEIERTIIQYYPRQALISPLDDDGIHWDYDPDNATLRSIVASLAQIDGSMRNGTRGRYDISEEVILFDFFRVQLCYIGPYAAVNFGLGRRLTEEQRDQLRQITEVLEEHGVTVLAEADLVESVPWIRHGTHNGSGATVWNCLFVHPEG